MNENYKTVVLGASPKPNRYAYMATSRLQKHGQDVIPVGIRKGEIEGIEIQQGRPDIKDVHTITLYLNPTVQREYYDYILGLSPKRIIFNPGTENPEFYQLIRQSGKDIQIRIACTLVMLSLGTWVEEA